MNGGGTGKSDIKLFTVSGDTVRKLTGTTDIVEKSVQTFFEGGVCAGSCNLAERWCRGTMSDLTKRSDQNRSLAL